MSRASRAALLAVEPRFCVPRTTFLIVTAVFGTACVVANVVVAFQ